MSPDERIERISALAEAARELSVDAIGGVDSSPDNYFTAIEVICKEIERLADDVGRGGYLHLAAQQVAP